MGTAGGSGADPGRGTHSRSELTTPHLSHLAQALNVQQLLKKKNLAFFGRFWQISAQNRPRNGPGERCAGAWAERRFYARHGN
jgi:hypothetical protein